MPCDGAWPATRVDTPQRWIWRGQARRGSPPVPWPAWIWWSRSRRSPGSG